MVGGIRWRCSIRADDVRSDADAVVFRKEQCGRGAADSGMDASAEDRRALTHDFIICTRDRPERLRIALSSIASQRLTPSAVLVIDSSDDPATEDMVRSWADSAACAWSVSYHRAKPGLTAQRNLGLQHSTADIVHFVDDDVVLESGYLEALARLFERDNERTVVGAGGLITNQPPRHPRLWWRLACMDSIRGGVILPSGVNVVVTQAEVPLKVQWLSGCSMSYRREIAARVRFDETLPGYALMEDVDFSFRAAKFGQLVLEPAAKLAHNVSPEGRWDYERLYRAMTYRRAWFVRKNLHPAAVLPFWWSVLAGACVQAVVSSFERSRFGMRKAQWQIQGAVDYLRGHR